ncbi:MAG: histidine--tRNA ligase [Mycoplasma sp.]|nr:histidine--tRNA ligase [Mycoplasma sp.]MDY4544872.1 histidine--tRNA ligase [Bacilli bacterium]
MITKPKGCYDVTGEVAKKYQRICEVVSAYAKIYNYKYIRTPLFESTELFKRGVGDTTDIVQKETYDFTDRGGRSFTLRPEGTAGVVRNFIEDKLYGNQSSVVKEFYIGTMYRYERPGLGRNREFTQFGVECLGSDDEMMDAEVISFSYNILKELGLDVTVKINNLGSVEDRENYKNALVEYLTPHINDLCEDCQNRIKTNPLRILDCKVDDQSEILKNAPSILDYHSKESNDRFNKILTYLDYLDIDYEVDNTLVRGLDYYDYMVYELKLNDSLALGGGGRYNHLVKNLGGPEVPAVGFACGIERIINEMNDESFNNIDVYVMCVNDEEKIKANIITQDLRLNNIICETNIMGKSLKAQFKEADNMNAKNLIILNSEDLSKGLITVKDNVTKEEVKVPEDEIIDYILGVI